ncbi:VCBS repeat-containing protein [Roseivirga misakiensis]|uniref:ASPIC/UnbV domain-containing protein n=1 Tax=Roseivirga misakiensis TaxID=1563681 RepID=A0A1E5T6A5_9BACT|nr:VCBS repeat-containing protein [Roseivirga misakiensis]OEK06890.1 hypothetical protein BFP71_04340 [Roseivirga misakiensis]
MRKHLLYLSLFICLGCADKSKEAPVFQLLSSSETGLNFKNEINSTKDFNILEYLYFYNGGGVAAGDINNDGLVDLYFTSNQASNKLYLNKGDLKFEDVTDQAGVSGNSTWSTGVTMADVNNDGYLDIYVSQVGDYKLAKGKNELFINNQDGTFSESAALYGLDFVGFSTQAAFFDYDKDGDLDMYLLNHSIKNPEVFTEAESRKKASDQGDKLFQNQASEGLVGFKDVTEEAGIYSSIIGFGLGIAISDINNDNWPDIYVSNDFTENDYLYVNNQDGTFSEQLETRIQHTSRFSMGNEIADLNNDGLGEIITTDMLPSDPTIWKKSVVEDKSEVYKIKLGFGYGHQYVRNTLQHNLGNGQFSDLSLFTNSFASDWSWSPLIFDMDNDGFQDIHITNGIYKRPNDLDYLNYQSGASEIRQKSMDELEEFLIETLPTLKISNYTGQNLGNFNIKNKAADWGLDQPSYSNGSTYADLDNDGDLELIINNVAQEAFVYKNTTDSKKAYLKIRFQGPEKNPFGIGAKVMVRTGDQVMTRENFNTRGFQSATAPELYFGLGKQSKKIDQLIVIWPNGNEQTLTNLDPNRTITLDYKSADRSVRTAQKPKTAQLENLTLPFEFVHKDDEFNDFDREYLMPRNFNHEGPALAIADVNGDGLDDVYFGGAKDQAGELWMQMANGEFKNSPSTVFQQLARAEDVSSHFFDADQDGDQDLYISTGGNEFPEGQLFSYDRLYLNDGKGNFRFSPSALPQIGSQGKAIAIEDIDGDGDLDVFVGSNIVSGAYGKNPQHYLLINNGRGRFQNEITQRLTSHENLGMLNSAKWFDFDGDGDQDLVMAGEWTSVQVYANNGSGQFEKLANEILDANSGWWYSLSIADVNQDGKPDIIAGNLGLNSKLKASEKEPARLYLNDFDDNGQTDPFVFHYQNGIESPYATRDDLIKQMAAIKKLHPDYGSYAALKGPEDLLGDKLNENTLVKEAKTFESKVFINKGNRNFEAIAMPQEAQYSPIMDIIADDINQDGAQDLLLFGNNFTFRNDYGRADAKPITLVLGDGKGNFTHSNDTHLNTQENWGEYRSAGKINIKGRQAYLALRNNSAPVLLGNR